MKYESKVAHIRALFNRSFPELKTLVDYVVDNPSFALWSGCSHRDRHHYGTGGLCQHTWEVLEFCEQNAEVLSNIEATDVSLDMKVLLFAALYHDVGKIWDYVPTTTGPGAFDIFPRVVDIENIEKTKVDWVGSTHKREIHHISRSGIEWTKAVAQTGLCKDIEDKVLHCILSHHGQREWGSPVAPKSREAWMLFLCDGISARMNDADKFDMVGQVKHV